jgi:restriction system protein
MEREALVSSIRARSPPALSGSRNAFCGKLDLQKFKLLDSAEGGIDGIGILRVNLVSFTVLFQGKRWKGSVGSAEVRNFLAAIQGRTAKSLRASTVSCKRSSKHVSRGPPKQGPSE